jgi:hypothetical protein
LDKKEFRDFCEKRNLDNKTIQAHLRMAQEFEGFLKRLSKNMSNATSQDLRNFVSLLMKNGESTERNLFALLRYSRFSENREMEIAVLEDFLGGHYVLKNLSDSVGRTAGEEKRREIFERIELPPLGTLPEDRPKITKRVMERLESKLDEESWKEALSSNLEAVPREEFLEERKKFLESKSLNDFLEKRRREYVDELDKHRREKTLYYTQEIDDEVLEYVRNTPTCQNGVREGDIIYVTKIPYMAKKYLHEKDEKMKRYYACHCPWVRESIKSGNIKISPNFCYCSAGFEKLPWDVIFDQPVKADVVESVLKGDLICKFAIHIPKEFLESEDATLKK